MTRPEVAGLDRRSRKGGSDMQFNLGDVVQMRKAHPCGSDQWEILRIGMDFRIKCKGCGRLVMLPRQQFEKGVKKIVAKPKEAEHNPLA